MKGTALKCLIHELFSCESPGSSVLLYCNETTASEPDGRIGGCTVGSRVQLMGMKIVAMFVFDLI